MIVVLVSVGNVVFHKNFNHLLFTSSESDKFTNLTLNPGRLPGIMLINVFEMNLLNKTEIEKKRLDIFSISNLTLTTGTGNLCFQSFFRLKYIFCIIIRLKNIDKTS